MDKVKVVSRSKTGKLGKKEVGAYIYENFCTHMYEGSSGWNVTHTKTGYQLVDVSFESPEDAQYFISLINAGFSSVLDCDDSLVLRDQLRRYKHYDKFMMIMDRVRGKYNLTKSQLQELFK